MRERCGGRRSDGGRQDVGSASDDDDRIYSVTTIAYDGGLIPSEPTRVALHIDRILAVSLANHVWPRLFGAQYETSAAFCSVAGGARTVPWIDARPRSKGLISYHRVFPLISTRFPPIFDAQGRYFGTLLILPNPSPVPTSLNRRNHSIKPSD